jgi:protein-disulfide isomerase
LNAFQRIATCLSVLLVAAAPAAAAPARDWAKVVARTPAGAFVQGNPAAKVKLVEYLSLSCPHCGKLEGEAIVPLTSKYIRTGLVSYEVRHALRDGFDFAGSMVARCNGPAGFFEMTPVLFANQKAWMERAEAWANTSAPKSDLPPEQLIPLLATGAGFDTMFAARGLSPEKVRACTANLTEQKILTAQADEAWKRPNFPGTPAFLINGTLAPGIASWAELDAALASALKK